jgi:hypothetical protein
MKTYAFQIPAERYFVRGRYWTAKEIAHETGHPIAVIYRRLRSDERGETLLELNKPCTVIVSFGGRFY